MKSLGALRAAASPVAGLGGDINRHLLSMNRHIGVQFTRGAVGASPARNLNVESRHGILPSAGPAFRRARALGGRQRVRHFLLTQAVHHGANQLADLLPVPVFQGVSPFEEQRDREHLVNVREAHGEIRNE